VDEQAIGFERFLKLESTVKQQGDELQDFGGTLDHLVNTVDTILLPTQKVHSDKLYIHETRTSEAHDYIVSQKGAWAFIQKLAVVIAAAASVATLTMKLMGK
jgi:hypothetical protein